MNITQQHINDFREYLTGYFGTKIDLIFEGKTTHIYAGGANQLLEDWIKGDLAARRVEDDFDGDRDLKIVLVKFGNVLPYGPTEHAGLVRAILQVAREEIEEGKEHLFDNDDE